MEALADAVDLVPGGAYFGAGPEEHLVEVLDNLALADEILLHDWV